MKLATLKQAGKVLKLVEETEIPLEQLQKLLASGLLSDLLKANLDEINRHEFRKLCSLVRFPVWKIIKIGTGLETAEEFRQALDREEIDINEWANYILGKPDFTAVTQKIELNLVKTTARELGFKIKVRCNQIFSRAKELGLELCPAEVGPQLRLQYKDQPNNEYPLLIAMKPIAGSDGNLEVFSVVRSVSGLWLGTIGYGCSLGLDHQWTFVLPRK